MSKVIATLQFVPPNAIPFKRNLTLNVTEKPTLLEVSISCVSLLVPPANLLVTTVTCSEEVEAGKRNH